MLLLLTLITAAGAMKEPELPLCPTNIQFFPQTLPMHCRMPTNANFAVNPFDPKPSEVQSAPTYPPPIFQSPPPNQQPPYPFLPGPGGLPIPPVAGLPMPMPMPGGGPPGAKVPVIVMPFYSPERKVKPTPVEVPSDTETDSSDTSSDTDDSRDSDGPHSWWRRGGRRMGMKKHGRRRHRKSRRHGHRNRGITPLLQYITKDGYVIYEKKISQLEAKDWLALNGNDRNREVDNLEKTEDTVAEDLEESMNKMRQESLAKRPKDIVDMTTPIREQKRNPIVKIRMTKKPKKKILGENPDA